MRQGIAKLDYDFESCNSFRKVLGTIDEVYLQIQIDLFGDQN